MARDQPWGPALVHPGLEPATQAGLGQEPERFRPAPALVGGAVGHRPPVGRRRGHGCGRPRERSRTCRDRSATDLGVGAARAAARPRSRTGPRWSTADGAAAAAGAVSAGLGRRRRPGQAADRAELDHRFTRPEARHHATAECHETPRATPPARCNDNPPQTNSKNSQRVSYENTFGNALLPSISVA